MKIGRTSITNFITAILFVWLYRFIHVEFLVKFYEYFGYYNNTTSSSEVIITDLICVLPILLYSGREVASNFISLLIYIFIYVPTVITLQYTYPDYYGIIHYQFLFMFTMVLFFLSDTVVLNMREIKTKTDVISINKLFLISLVLAAVVIIGYGPSSLRIVSLQDVYEVRDANMEVTGGSAITAYPVLWLTYFFIPLFASVGLVKKKPILVIASILVALLIYAADGAKAALFSPMFAIGIFYCLKWFKFKRLFPLILGAFAVISVIAVIGSETSPEVFMMASVLLMRTLSISGLLTPVYIDFFDQFPYTYYSHINIVNAITGGYPYDITLGKVVWGEMNNLDINEAMNANANFLLTDGISAWGIPGVIIISIVFFFLLLLINKVSERHNKTFVFVMLIGAVLSLTNVSLFTTLLSCGLLFVILLLRYCTLKT